MTPTLLQEYANLIAPSRNHKSTSVLHTFKCYLLNARLSRMIWNVNVKTNTIYSSQDMEEIRYPPEDEWLKKRGTYIQWNILLYNYWAVSDSLQPLGMQHSRLPCPSLSPSVCSKPCPLCQWCYCTILPSAALFSFCLLSFIASGSFQMSCSSHQMIKVLELQFSISPSNEYSELISFRIDWFDLLAVQGTRKSLLQHHSTNSSGLSFLYGSTVTSVHDFWRNNSFDYMDLCWQGDVFAF